MKHLVFTLLAALLVSGAASAQRLMVGVRGGVNFTDYSFVPTRIGDIRFSPGSTSRSTSICNRNWTTPSSTTPSAPGMPETAA